MSVLRRGTARPGQGWLRATRWLNRGVMLPVVARISAIDLPAADAARLSACLDPEQAAFLAANHPDFLADWLLDKELADRFAPRMAHWAAFDVVHAHPLANWFWRRNNVISTGSGPAGIEHAVRWALAGHGVMLHPEGTVAWQGGRVGPLLPGIATMAWEARRRGAGVPVRIVPILYRHRFVGDAEAALARELALVERRLGCPPGGALTIQARLAALLTLTLERERAGLAGRAAPGAYADEPSGFFARAEAVSRELRGRLEERYGPAEGEFPRVLHRLRRAIRLRAANDPQEARRDRARLDVWAMWQGFSAAEYGQPTLSQEQIAECLKRLRGTLVRGRPGDVVRNLLPRPVAPRVAHVRVAAPIEVEGAPGPEADPGEARARLVAELRGRMQQGLTALAAEVEPLVAPWRRPNPLWTETAT